MSSIMMNSLNQSEQEQEKNRRFVWNGGRNQIERQAFLAGEDLRRELCRAMSLFSAELVGVI